MGSPYFLQIFPTQGLNLGLPHCRQILYHMSHQGSSYVYTHGYYNFLFPGLASNVTEDNFRYYVFMSIILKSYSVVLSWCYLNLKPHFILFCNRSLSFKFSNLSNKGLLYFQKPLSLEFYHHILNLDSLRLNLKHNNRCFWF